MADSFASSFGDPRKYMGQSPLAEVGKALKTGAVLWGLQQSGAIKALDKLGIKPTQSGGFSYNNSPNPAGSVPPMATAGAGMGAPASGNSGAPAVPPVDRTQPVMPNAPTPAIATPVYDSAPMSTTPPANIGVDVLDGKYHGNEQSFVNPQAQRDFNPYMLQDTNNPVALTGNEYQQIPGYGTLGKAIKGFVGGMMG
jgi:hypothetical protein